MKNAVFWDVAQCRYCIYRRFGGMHRLHLQGRRKKGNIRERGTSVNRWLQPYPLHRELDGSQKGCGRCGDEKNLVHLPGDRTPSVHPVARRYTDWTILIPLYNSILIYNFLLYLSRYSNWLRAGRPRVGVQVPVGSRIFSIPRRPDWIWGPPNLLSNR
jgi:hypothetical protein